jgi:hypothetical protein
MSTRLAVCMHHPQPQTRPRLEVRGESRQKKRRCVEIAPAVIICVHWHARNQMTLLQHLHMSMECPASRVSAAVHAA